MIQKILASVVTGIGGHYLNKRWDKALLFMFLLILGWVTASVYVFLSFQNMAGSPEEMASLAQSASQKSSIISLAIITLVWLVSNIVTVIDSKNSVTPNMNNWSKSGIIVAIISSLLSSLLIISSIFASYTALVKKPFEPSEVSSTFEYDSTEFVSHNFYANIYYGGVPRNSHKLPSPLDGNSTLRGKFLFQGKPASGVTLSLVLNSQYQAKNIKTDSSGEFSLQLPAGLWVVNSIQTNSWEGKPSAGEYSIYDGNEPKLTDSSYSRHANFNRNGITIDIEASPNTIHLNYIITEDIKIKWPSSTQKTNHATINNTIQWEPQPGAQKYSLAIQRIKSEGSTTYYEPVVSRIIENSTQLNLSSLKHQETKNKKNYEYGVEIFAFDKDGILLSQFTKIYRGGTFILSDNNILVEENMNEFWSPTDNESPVEFEKKMEAMNIANSRVKAVRTLIDAKMLQEAQKLLGVVESEYAKGKKEMLTGYIFALQGNCSKSEQLLENAKIINPNICIPEEYKELCQ
jgi:hypothetical protein